MSKKVISPFLFSLTILLLAAANRAVAAECSANLGFNPSLVSFNTSSLVCNKVWSEQDFLLLYSNDSATWNFVLSAPNNGVYIGIGFSKDGMMIGSSAVVGWLASNGKGTAKRYFLRQKMPSGVVPDKGDLVLVEGKTTIFSENSRLFLAFQLNTSKAQPTDKLLYALGPQGFIPASDNLLKYHSARINTTIVYETKSNAPEPSPSTPQSPSPSSPTNNSPPPSTPQSPSPSSPTDSSVGRVNVERLVVATVPAVAMLLSMCLL